MSLHHLRRLFRTREMAAPLIVLGGCVLLGMLAARASAEPVVADAVSAAHADRIATQGAGP